jgi:hypothetical protein
MLHNQQSINIGREYIVIIMLYKESKHETLLPNTPHSCWLRCLPRRTVFLTVQLGLSSRAARTHDASKNSNRGPLT